MGKASPKKFVQGGWATPYELTKKQRQTLLARGVTESDLAFIEGAMKRYYTLKDNPEPTDAEVLASLDGLEAAVLTLRKRLIDLDDVARMHIEEAGQRYGLPFQGFQEHIETLDELDRVVVMGRREIPQTSAGRRQDSSKVGLAEWFLHHFGEKDTVKNVLLVVLPEDGVRNIDRVLAKAVASAAHP